MKKTVLTFGLICSGITAIMMLATAPFADRIGFAKGEILGYAVIVVAALMIFFGIRSYRENVSAGRLTFGRGLAVGVLIALISSLCYVATWEVVYHNFMPDFADKYAANLVEKARASGATPEKIQKATQDAEQFKQMYKNPAFNIGITFLEIFPVGVVATLLSAAILRRKAASQPA